MHFLAILKIAVQEGHDCKSLVKLRAGSDNPVSLFSVDDRRPTIRGLHHEPDHLHPHRLVAQIRPRRCQPPCAASISIHARHLTELLQHSPHPAAAAQIGTAAYMWRDDCRFRSTTAPASAVAVGRWPGRS
jgi:hypothetical protein